MTFRLPKMLRDSTHPAVVNEGTRPRLVFGRAEMAPATVAESATALVRLT